MVKWITISMAAIGLAIGVYMAATSDQDQPQRPPDQPPSTNPFDAGIAATGIVEAATRNIEIAAPEPALVMTVHVEVNDKMKAGDPLFQLDARPLQAQLKVAKARLELAQTKVDRLEAEPRPERLPIFQAGVERADAELDLARQRYESVSELFKKDAATQDELDAATFNLDAAQARVAEAKATLTELRAGAWEKELAVARADAALAKSRIQSLEIRIDRLTVRSPVQGSVVKRNIEPGEFAAPADDQPALVVGDLSTLHVRAKVDEEDAPVLRQGADAIARIRGAVRERLDLKMLRIEPLAQPKRQLTGVNTELIDTRVIEVVFEITDKSDVPVYPGQIVDVFIEKDDGEPAKEKAARRK